MFRCGTFLSFMDTDAAPDIITISKHHPEIIENAVGILSGTLNETPAP